MKLYVLLLALLTGTFTGSRFSSRLLWADRIAGTGAETSLDPAVIRLRKIYTAELHVREATGHNDGTRVEAYLRYVGLKKGSPWCSAFVCFCLGQAGITNPRSGYCPDLFPASKVIWQRLPAAKLKIKSLPGAGSQGQKAESGSLFSSTHNPEPSTSLQPSTADPVPRTGDVFGLFFPDKGRIAHVGFIEDWGDKYIVTTEGNTNEAGSREGGGVYCKRRLVSSVYKVSRFL